MCVWTLYLCATWASSSIRRGFLSFYTHTHSHQHHHRLKKLTTENNNNNTSPTYDSRKRLKLKERHIIIINIYRASTHTYTKLWTNHEETQAFINNSLFLTTTHNILERRTRNYFLLFSIIIIFSPQHSPYTYIYCYYFRLQKVTIYIPPRSPPSNSKLFSHD